MKEIIKSLVKRVGYEIKKPSDKIGEDGMPKDITDTTFIEFYNKCKAYSTCSIEPMYNLYKSVEYIVKNNISGDLVECGIFKGGSAMMMCYSLIHFGDTKRKVYLYDTFEGMSAPIVLDVDISGETAESLLAEGLAICYSSIEEVKENIEKTNYPKDYVFFIKGKVEDTLPEIIPDKISLLRLDTDWYESTYHELINLYPILEQKGVLIIDDYGHWKGARKAVDKYFKENKIFMLLNRIDYTVRSGIKTH
ncbi:MAG: class I SAM-dependent methyltransferase [Vicingus serpentipes]|nr:class I SAM-dependent methyltransferase [Vicingus serpentipes]